MRCRQFDMGIGQLCRELLHGAFFAVYKECALRSRLFLPCQQFSLVGVGGEPVDCIDAGPYRNILAQYVYLLGAVDDPARESSNGGVTDEYDA